MHATKGWVVVVIVIATIALPLRIEGELLPIRSYTTADGLAADHIDCIVPDSRGFVWFCTPEGLTRFDGYRMVSFGIADGLPTSAVETFLETRSGAYLAGTDRGLSRLRASTRTSGKGGFDKPVYALMESRSGRIWCGTKGGLLEVLSDGNFRPQPLPGLERVAVTDIRDDAGGNLWVATNGGIYVLGKDGAVQFIAKKDGLPNDWVNALLLDGSGRMWVGTRGGMALMRAVGAGSRHSVQRVYTNDGSALLNISARAEGSDGAIWVGTENGISRLLPGNGDPVFQNLTRANGLSDRAIVSLAADRAGNMWAGTEAAGVMRIGSAGFVTFHEQDGLTSDRVFAVLGERTGRVLAVALSAVQPGRSINIFDPVKRNFHAVVPKVFGEKPGWGQHQILLQSRTGEWWAATNVGLCRYAPMSAADLAARPPKACYAQDVQVFAVFEDSKGAIWASAQTARENRLMRWDPRTQAISALDGAGRGLVSAFAEDRHGAIWMGVWGGGLLRYDGGQFTSLKLAMECRPARSSPCSSIAPVDCGSALVRAAWDWWRTPVMRHSVCALMTPRAGCPVI
jgi:ligand-binding sensor domain-containing protein